MDVSPVRSLRESRVRITSLFASFLLALAVVRLAGSPRNDEDA